MAKPMNMERRIRALETAPVTKTRNPVALALLLRGSGRRHGDAKKQRSREACRGKVHADA